MQRSVKFTLLISLSLVSLFIFSACTQGNKSNDNLRKTSVAQRGDNLSRAEQIAPAPNVVNFPIRKALVKFTQREDQINTPWYIYLKNVMGEYTGYYVAQTYPVNACDFLSSTEDINSDHSSTLILQAPSLDGIYYGGGGASAACNIFFFFDYSTDALHTFADPYWEASDQPLDVNVPKIGSHEATPVAGE